jgi:hypothetical protein
LEVVSAVPRRVSVMVLHAMRGVHDKLRFAPKKELMNPFAAIK